jgi:hypothetical protein
MISSEILAVNQFIQNSLTNDQFSGLCEFISLKIGVFLCHEKCKQLQSNQKKSNFTTRLEIFDILGMENLTIIFL